MARFTFIVTGEGGKSVTLPVVVQTAKIILQEATPQGIGFTIENTLTRQVSFTSVSVVKSGPAQELVTAVVRFDNIVIEPGAIFENFLDIEAVEALTEEDTFSIEVSAEEAVGV